MKIASADDIVPELRENASSLWIAPGSPYKNLGKALQTIRHARERGIPCLETCGVFQPMIIEYARHVLGFVNVQHAESTP